MNRNSAPMGRLVALMHLLAAASATACYTYAPLQGVPPVGSDVRVNLSDEEALRVSGQTGELSRTIDGRYTGAAGDTIFLSVATFRVPEEVAGSRQFRQSLAISREGLDGFSSRELSLVRSGIVAGLAAGGIVLVISEVVVGGGNDPNGEGGNPTGTLIPILRIPLGR